MQFMWGEGARGLWFGAVIGGLLGLGACMWLFQGTLLFPGDTILFGAVICGLFGFLFGESFIEWIKDRLHWFVGS